MAFDLSGRTAIVTGAASGIGRATAERFAAEGANVVVADLHVAGGQETVDRIEAAGGTATFVEVDVSDAASVEAMVRTAVDTYGGLDVACVIRRGVPDECILEVADEIDADVIFVGRHGDHHVHVGGVGRRVQAESDREVRVVDITPQ